MLLQHRYYVYHDGANIFARMEFKKPILVETCATAQDAYDKVQSIINPTGRKPDSFAEVNVNHFTGDPIKDASGNEIKLGFLSKEFQDAISPNCEDYVKAAYKVK